MSIAALSILVLLSVAIIVTFTPVLKVYSTATIVMGIVTFLCVWLVSFFIL